MLWLILLWLVSGALIGLIATGANLAPAAWGKYGWLHLCATGMGSALVGGGLGFWLLGKFFATPTALWVAVVVVLIGPRGLNWLLASIRKRGSSVPS